jgi:hypothetical protein
MHARTGQVQLVGKVRVRVIDKHSPVSSVRGEHGHRRILREFALARNLSWVTLVSLLEPPLGNRGRCRVWVVCQLRRDGVGVGPAGRAAGVCYFPRILIGRRMVPRS